MKIIFTTLHNSTYKPLAEKTLTLNKLPYCIKHGYPLLVKDDNFRNIHIGFEKAYLIQTAFNDYPDCEWVFFSECDTFITNMDIKLEDLIHGENKHVVITADINGINAGSFFVKNSAEGKGFINDMIDNIGKFEHEQAFIIDSYFGSKKHTDIIALYPQKKFNSYDYYLYGSTFPTGLDYFGNNGRWEPGDFIIHFVARTLKERLILADEYLQKSQNQIKTQFFKINMFFKP